MIQDHTRIWLLRPGVRELGDVPSYLDETDARPAAEQFSERWRPIDELWRLEGSALHGDGQAHELLGAIHLRNELVMLFEGSLVAIVQSDRSLEVSQIVFEIGWIELPDDSEGCKAPAAEAAE